MELGAQVPLWACTNQIFWPQKCAVHVTQTHNSYMHTVTHTPHKLCQHHCALYIS